MLLIGIATAGITFSIQATFSASRALDGVLRIVLASLALVVLLHPDRRLAWLTCVPVGLFIGYWLLKRRSLPATERAKTGSAAERP